MAGLLKEAPRSLAQKTPCCLAATNLHIKTICVLIRTIWTLIREWGEVIDPAAIFN
jgi:hypothetical protein